MNFRPAQLGDALPDLPCLVHGTDGSAWALLEWALREGHASRIGLEDTLVLPCGETAADNAALVRADLALAVGP